MDRLANLCGTQVEAVHDQPSRTNFFLADSPIGLGEMPLDQRQALLDPLLLGLEALGLLLHVDGDLVGQRQACVSSSDTKPDTLTQMAERAVAMAREAPEDPTVGLADPGELARDWDVNLVRIAEVLAGVLGREGDAP